MVGCSAARKRVVRTQRLYGVAVPDSVGFARSRARIERICDDAAEAGMDARTFRLQILEELRRAVAFDAYAWLLTDPQSAVGAAPVADVPWIAELPRQIRLKYCTAVNRWTALTDRPVALLHEATGGDLAQSLVWRDLLARHGVHDVASGLFADRFGCWAFLELWRSETVDRFTRADAEFLADLVKPVTLALRRCQASTFTARPARELPRVGPVVLVLSPELLVRGQTAETPEYLRILIPPVPDREPIPAVAYNVAAQLLAIEAGVDGNAPSARVHVAKGLWMTARAARLDGPGPSRGHDIAVTLEESSGAERVDVFGRSFGLTLRERELIDHLVEGGDTRGVAQRMFLTENTVQDHLKAIFAKTSARNRRTLLARALGS
jgi:DNA-binding CsgD family transcriptional regulator